MSSTATPIDWPAAVERPAPLSGQTVVLIGGSSGIGLETARLAGAEGADVILVARDRERLERAAEDVGAAATVAVDATSGAQLERLFGELDQPFDHLLSTAGRPYYGTLDELDFVHALQSLDRSFLMPLRIAKLAAPKMRPGGTLLFMGGTAARHAGPGLALPSAVTAGLPALVASLALELAPIRVNVIAAGFVDTALSAELLGTDLNLRREQLRETLPIARVVGPKDVAALAVHLMSNTALTGATYDVDGGQQLAPAAW